jgi:hypothetical protein
VHGTKSLEGAPPEWFATIKIAERMGTEPWVLDPDERIMPWEWASRVLLVMNCEAEATNAQHRQAASRQRIGRVRSGKGRFQR